MNSFIWHLKNVINFLSPAIAIVAMAISVFWSALLVRSYRFKKLKNFTASDRITFYGQLAIAVEIVACSIRIINPHPGPWIHLLSTLVFIFCCLCTSTLYKEQIKQEEKEFKK